MSTLYFFFYKSYKLIYRKWLKGCRNLESFELFQILSGSSLKQYLNIWTFENEKRKTKNEKRKTKNEKRKMIASTLFRSHTTKNEGWPSEFDPRTFKTNQNLRLKAIKTFKTIQNIILEAIQKYLSLTILTDLKNL